jgi:glucokinase
MIGAIDIGGSKTAVGGIREDGTIVHRSECATEPLQGFENAIRRVQQLMRAIVDTSGKLDGIGIACPGPLDPLTGIIGEVGTLPGWQGGNLIEAFEAEFRVPVAVENDADAAALAEVVWGTAAGSWNFLYVTVSTGIGGAIVINGELYRGVGNSHPELGHQIIDRSGPRCYCGSRGCWESLASGSAMSVWMREQDPDAPCITAERICDLARHGNERARRAVEREAYYLGLGLANLVTLFTPEMIALGGGVMKSASLILKDAVKVVGEVCTQVPADKTRICIASLGSDVGLLGAAQSWLHRYQ